MCIQWMMELILLCSAYSEDWLVVSFFFNWFTVVYNMVESQPVIFMVSSQANGRILVCPQSPFGVLKNCGGQTN
jgi:hypothetical protein